MQKKNGPWKDPEKDKAKLEVYQIEVSLGRNKIHTIKKDGVAGAL